MIAVLLGGTDVIALGIGELPLWWMVSEVIVMHTLAIVALVCYVVVRYGDPGELERTHDNCFPLPQEMIEWIQKSAMGPPAPPPLTKNIVGHPNRENPSSCRDSSCYKHSYCIRCHVWRPPHGHHCRTCQRCVVGFDHHCGVFGRCIASGNIVPFYILLTVFYLGFFGGAFFSIAGLLYRFPMN